MSDADVTVRIDNTAAHPSLRMQIVDEPANADFVLVDDSDAPQPAAASASIKSIRLDAAGSAKSRPDRRAVAAAAPTTRFTCSRRITPPQDAAALFAVMQRPDARPRPIARRQRD